MNHLAHILRDWDAFLVRLSRVGESSQSGTSFEDVIIEQLFRTTLNRTAPIEATKVKLFMVMHLNT